MDTTQIYTLVNQVTSEALGAQDLKVADLQGLISLGDTVLSSSANTDAYLNTLTQRIARSILSFRAYRNKLSGLVKDQIEWGAIVQKIKIDMPLASEDVSPVLEDGKSIDPYIVSKPVVHQKLFTTRAPYTFYITTQREWLRESFLSEEALTSFYNGVYGEVRNKMEVALENLGRATINNFIAEAIGGDREIALVTNYNMATGSTLTADSCLYDEGFLRYAIRMIKLYMKGMTDMSTIYNDGTTTRHTPIEDGRLIILSEFEQALETVVQWAAFNENYVRLTGYTEVNFWQAKNKPMSIEIQRVSDKTKEAVDNIIAVYFDRDALGTFKEVTDVLTTPVNARGMYYNTFWHENQCWFNDLSENGVFFTLN